MIKRRVDREDKLDIPMFFGEEMLSIRVTSVINNIGSDVSVSVY